MNRTLHTSILLYLTLVSFASQAVAVGMALESGDDAAKWKHTILGMICAAGIAYLDDRDERRRRRRGDA